MNLNQLEYFVAAAENLNFTRAARQCFISQTAMTQQMQALEKTVGVPLFIRDKHHVELTAAGRVFLKEARGILRQSDEALRLARTASDGTEGEINIGFISGYGYSDCGDILGRFHSEFPGIKMRFVRDTMSGLMKLVMGRDCDAAFTVHPQQTDYEGLEHLLVKRYPMFLVVDAGHPLSGAEGVRVSELFRERFIIMQPSARARDEMEEMLWIYQRGGFLPEVVAVEKEPETIYLMVSLGMGVCVLPGYVAQQYDRRSVSVIPIVRTDGSSETLDFELIWSRENGNPAVENLLGSLGEYDG